jgi:hypothetical protein
VNTRFLVPALLAALLTGGLAFGQTTEGDQASMRGQRICELYELTLDEGQIVANIWNNFGFHDCPDAWLEQIDRADFFVGGPRWRSVDEAVVVDEAGELVAPPSDDSHVVREVPAGLGLTMGLAARVPLPITVDQLERQLDREITSMDDLPRQARQTLLSQLESSDAYSVTEVERQQLTVMTHVAGSEIFVLHDGRCDYAMKYYTSIYDASLVDEGAIAQLGDKLSLPPGFSFEVRVLDEDLRVEELDGLAHILTDEFGNSYDRFRCAE